MSRRFCDARRNRADYLLSVTTLRFLSLRGRLGHLTLYLLLIGTGVSSTAASAIPAEPSRAQPADCAEQVAERVVLPFEGSIGAAGICFDSASIGNSESGYSLIYVIEREQNATLNSIPQPGSDRPKETDSGGQGFGIEIVDVSALPIIIKADSRHGSVTIAGVTDRHPWSASLKAVSSIIKQTTGSAASKHKRDDLTAALAQIEFENLSAELRGRIRTLLGNAALARADFSAAQRWAASRPDNDPLSNRWLGIVAFEANVALGANADARASLCRALAAGDSCRAEDASNESLLAGIAANRLGLLAHRSGDLKEARDWYLHAIDLYAGRYPRGAAVANQNIGGIASTRGEFDEAEQYFSASAELYEANGWDGPLATTLRNLAAANSSRGEFGSASENLRNSLRAAEEAHRPQSQVETLVHLAELMRRLGRLTEAEGYASQARDLLGDRNWLRQRASWAIVSGRIAQAQGNTNAAVKQLTDALVDYQTLGNTWSIASTQLALARAHNGHGDAAAQQHADAALKLARKHGYSRHESEALLLSGVAARLSGNFDRAQKLFQQTLALQNDTLDLLGGFETRLELAELASSQAEWKTAIDWLEEARPLADASAKTIARADDRAFFANNLRRADRLHIRALLNTEQPQAALNQVLSRYGRASLLSETDGESPIDPMLRDALAKQAAELHRAGGKNSSAPADPELTSRIRRLILEMSSQREEQAATMPSARELMASLPANSVYLHLVPDDGSSHQWVVRRDGISYRALPNADKIKESIAQLREAIRRRADISQQREYLSEVLLPELAPEEVIYVAAEGLFAGLPLALLGSQRYLIEEHRIITLTNAALLTEPRPQLISDDSRARVTVFADPVFGGIDMRLPPASANVAPLDRALPRLPFTALEAAAILRLNPDAHVLSGFDATREALLDPALENQDVLHIAVHGLLDEQLPEASGLYLSAVNASGDTRNALVTLVDLYQSRFPQSLIVLSACDTAAGAQLAGESGLSLARAFLRQGSRQVIATQWPVADATSAKLFENFYEGLLVKKQPVSHALRHAQLSVLANPRSRHPYFWAGYALAGPD